MFGNTFRFERRESDDIWEGFVQTSILAICVCSLNFSFENIDVHELLFQAEYFPSKFGQSVSEGSLPKKEFGNMLHQWRKSRADHGGGGGGTLVFFPDSTYFAQFSRHRVGVPIVHYKPLWQAKKKKKKKKKKGPPPSKVAQIKCPSYITNLSDKQKKKRKKKWSTTSENM